MNAPVKLQVTPTAIHDVLVIEPKVFGDARGWFTESFNAQDFAVATGLHVEFVQDNHSFSRQWTLRGLHYQLEQTQGTPANKLKGLVQKYGVSICGNCSDPCLKVRDVYTDDFLPKKSVISSWNLFERPISKRASDLR